MNKKELRRISGVLSYILRHNPSGLEMDTQGWVNTDELLSNLNIDKDILDEIVSTDNKNRYSYCDDEDTMIRANQGHSIDFVDIDFDEVVPPEFLYHGTSPTFVDSILEQGLIKRTRQYVHLSKDKETAINVGSRHSKGVSPVILTIEAGKMDKEGHTFYLSKNGVWLAKYVPSLYIKK
jgi:putative RNA 2'-phosphotransferase